WEPEFGERNKKTIGAGFELKQHIPIYHGIYSYVDICYNRYFKKDILGPTYGNSLQNYCGANLGIGYRF
ncbi:MAG: hypothetical protein RI955_1537, partial [Bacteroidota bacterium]